MTIWELIALAKSSSKGSMFHFKGAVNTINDLPETGEDGDVYLVDSEDSYFAWDGEGWTDIGQILTADDAAELFDQLEDAGDQQVARVQQKGEDVLESIPADYSDLSDEVDDLKSIINMVADFQPSINLFDGDFDATGYINPSTGEDAASNDYKRTSKFYKISDETATTLYGLLTTLTPTLTIVFYDSTKVQTGYYGKSSSVTSFNTTIPANTKYFRAYTSSTFTGKTCISTVFTSEYVDPTTDVTLLADLNDNSVSLSTLKTDIVSRNNLVVPQVNGYLNKSNGNVSSNDSYRVTGNYIPIAPNHQYALGIYNEAGSPCPEVLAVTVCFYTDGNSHIASGAVYSSGYPETNCTWENGHIIFTSPSTATKCKIGVNDAASHKYWYLGEKADVIYYAQPNAIKTSNFVKSNFLCGKVVAVFGDSIMGNTRDYTSTPQCIASACGATIYNFGFGGCRMSVNEREWDNCSMYRLADDIYNEDFSGLVSAITTGWSGMPGYFRNTVKWLNACDFSKVDAIIIAYGTNDYAASTSVLDNPNDKLDTTTVCGALRYSIKQILSRYPQIQILVSCPVFRTLLRSGTYEPISYSDSQDYGSGTLVEYASAFKQACDDMNVEFIDLYHTTGFNPYTRLYYFPADDGTHPNEKGRKRMGTLLAGKLMTMFANA